MLNSNVVHADDSNQNINDSTEVVENKTQTSGSNQDQENVNTVTKNEESTNSNDTDNNTSESQNDSQEQNNDKSTDDQDTDEDDVTVEEYENNVKDFKPVKMVEVKDLLAKQDNQDRVMYIGRPTCYYCRQFSPDLKDFNKIVKDNLLYFNIDAEEGAHEYAFKVIGIPGTPTTMRFINGKIVSAWIGGEKTGQELYDFLYSVDANKLVDQYKIKQTDDTDMQADNVSSADDQENYVTVETNESDNTNNDNSVAVTDFSKGILLADADNVASSTADLDKVTTGEQETETPADESEKHNSVKQKAKNKKVTNTVNNGVHKESVKFEIPKKYTAEKNTTVQNITVKQVKSRKLESRSVDNQVTLPHTGSKKNVVADVMGMLLLVLGLIVGISFKRESVEKHDGKD